MPEGPEVRRYADLLDTALRGRRISHFSARTKAARAFLAERDGVFDGCRVERVWSHGKNLIGDVEGGLFFYAHLMMWGRWTIVDDPAALAERDRRERARIVVDGGTAAILLSAPVFEVGEGDPVARFENLANLGPDVLPYDGPAAFDAAEFLRRLDLPERAERTIGAVLLDQTLCAGIGNYLRAEILWHCLLDPWRLVGELTEADRDALVRAIPMLCDRAYRNGGATVPDASRDRMRADTSLVYAPGSDWGTRHAVFRRTNLPCLSCGDTIRQQRQVTREDDEGEKTRVIFFCPTCQGVEVQPKPKPKRRGRNAPPD